MKLTSAVRGKTNLIVIGLMAAAGFAGPACADPVGGGRVVTVKSGDTVIIEDGNRVIYISSPRNRTSSTKSDPRKRVSYEGIGTEEAIRRHNEVVGQLMDSPSRPVECR